MKTTFPKNAALRQHPAPLLTSRPTTKSPRLLDHQLFPPTTILSPQNPSNIHVASTPTSFARYLFKEKTQSKCLAEKESPPAARPAPRHPRERVRNRIAQRLACRSVISSRDHRDCPAVYEDHSAACRRWLHGQSS